MKIISGLFVLKRGLTDLCYRFFSNLSNPTRLAILEKLLVEPMNLTSLAKSLGQEQSMISHNLKPLERCVLVYFMRKGRNKLYRVNMDTVGGLFNIV
jgi:DNA-binding transcriptional ArsR family regulator